ncbi:MAG: DNA polymerase I [Planctomycetaceae bacterium]|nr:DNA polymerase I [Planctomycetaceae bacterium]
MPELLYLIDVYSLVFQVFHAIPEMTGPQGLPTNAVFGFTRDILNILGQKHPTHILCATDPAGPGEREGLYPAYKAQRSATPEELRPQFPLIAETIRAFGIPLLEVAGWEADDVIATVVQSAGGRDMDVCIVSNDKDLRQLLGPRVRIYHVRKDQFLTETELLADWGVRPDQVIDFQSLVGDSVDNVPGVPLVGPKKASALLQQFGTLDEVLAHADLAPGAKLRENLKTFADQARLSKLLVTLRRDLPVAIDWNAARVGQWDAERLQGLFRQFGFRRFGDDLRALERASSSVQSETDQPRQTQPAAQQPPSAVPHQTSLFDDQDPPRPNEPTTLDAGHPESPAADRPADTLLTPPSNRELEFGDDSPAAGESSARPSSPQPRTRALHVTVVDTREKLDTLAAALRERQQFCLDLETTQLDAVRADIVGWAISWEPHAGYYIPVRAPAGEPQLDPQVVVDVLRPILESPTVEVSNQNIKYDMLVLRRAGIRLRGLGVDPMVGSYLLEAGARSHSLDELARRYFEHEMIPISDLIGKGLFQKRMDEVEVAKAAEYAAEDAEVAWELSSLIAGKLREQGLWDLYWNLERPLIEVLVEMQHNGIRVDAEQLRQQSGDLEQRLGGIRREIYELAGREFNIDSTKQLQQILFVELGLPVIRKTKTGASTDQETLEQLAAKHPLPSKLVEHRGLTKLKNTYLDALPALINPATGRLHTSFNQVVAATGRLSSSEPNLQNIPVRTAEGQRVRRAFLPAAADWQLVCADYSQIELRMLAHFSGDEVLQEAFRQGGDIHTTVAAEVFKVSPESVDSDMRRVAKAVNFGVIYGQSPFGLAANLGISKAEAARFIENYFARYAGVDRYLEKLLSECLQTGYATTLLGRRRAIEGIRSTPQPDRQRNLPERTAINTVIQGSAADLIKQAMINVYRRLERDQHPARLLLQIHDELVLECPQDRVADLAELLRYEMENALPLSVPMKVDLAAGPNWLEVETVLPG